MLVIIIIVPIIVLLVCRCVWSMRLGACREPAGEVAMCARGLRTYAIPRPADALRQTAAEAAVVTDRVGPGDRADVLRATRRQDADWDSHQRHAAQRRIVQLALHARHPMTSQAPAPYSAYVKALYTLKLPQTGSTKKHRILTQCFDPGYN